MNVLIKFTYNFKLSKHQTLKLKTLKNNLKMNNLNAINTRDLRASKRAQIKSTSTSVVVKLNKVKKVIFFFSTLNLCLKIDKNIHELVE